MTHDNRRVGLLSDLRELLRRLQTGRTQLIAERSKLSIDGLRRMVLDACARDDQREYPMRMSNRQRYNLLENTDELIFELAQCIADRVNLSHVELDALLPDALTETLSMFARLEVHRESKSANLSSSQETLVYHCCGKAWWAFEERCTRDLQSPREYAIELELIDVNNEHPKVSADGFEFLSLSGIHVVRWLVARELQSSLDRDDPWRGHSSVAEVFKTRGKLEAYDFEFQYDTGWPWSNPVLPRWTDMGVVTKKRWERGDEPDGGVSYELTELGSRILNDLLWPDKAVVRAEASSRSSSAGKRASGSADPPTRFRFINLLGKGGWAEVWRAEDRMLRRAVAIKLFEPGGTHIASASDHAQALARVNHPNVVKIFDACTLTHPQSGEPWNAIIMEILEGPTLAAAPVDRMQRMQVAEVCRGVLDGLGALHEADVIHSDIHGENVVLHNGIPKILDALYRGTLAACSGTEKQHLKKRDLQQATSEVALFIRGSGRSDIASEFRVLAKDAESTAALVEILGRLFPLPAT